MALGDIAKAYLKSYFIFDVISTIPCLVTLEKQRYYQLKLFRFVHFRKFLQQINDLLQMIFNKIGLNKQVIERIFYFMT